MVCAPLYLCICVKCRQVHARSTVLLNQSIHTVALNRRIGTRWQHRSVQRAARGEIWENISTPGCQIPALQARAQNRWTRFTFCKMRAFNRLTLEQNMFSAQMLHNFTLKFEFNQSSPSRAICSNCSGRAVHIPQNFQISRELFKK